MVPDSAENKLIKIIGLVAAILLLADLAILNFKAFSVPVYPEVTEGPIPTARPKATQEPVISPAEVPSPSVVLPTSPAANVPLVKEIYVPLGSGSAKGLDWTGIPGAEVVLDTANFPKVKSVIFEAFLRIPTGNGQVYAKLYNVTDQHDVWFSEVRVEGGGTQRMESKNISLDSGRKLYRVMMKTTMGYEAILESARLKIILE